MLEGEVILYTSMVLYPPQCHRYLCSTQIDNLNTIDHTDPSYRVVGVGGGGDLVYVHGVVASAGVVAPLASHVALGVAVGIVLVKIVRGFAAPTASANTRNANTRNANTTSKKRGARGKE